MNWLEAIFVSISRCRNWALSNPYRKAGWTQNVIYPKRSAVLPWNVAEQITNTEHLAAAT